MYNFLGYTILGYKGHFYIQGNLSRQRWISWFDGVECLTNQLPSYWALSSLSCVCQVLDSSVNLSRKMWMNVIDVAVGKR